jgi:phosphatidylserine/phosphatidylglycerophosphate/cardiolipin synthase-like enzyme
MLFSSASLVLACALVVASESKMDLLDDTPEFEFTRIPRLPDPPTMPQNRFSRPLSPKAAKIYRNVLAVTAAYPDNSPTPFDMVGASATYKGHTLAYGNGPTFSKAFHDLIVEAKEEVLITSLSWAKHTQLADGIKAALLELSDRAVKAGRVVRVLIAVDPFGALVFNKQLPPLKVIFGEKTKVKPSSYGLPSSWQVLGLDLHMRTYHKAILGVLHNKMMLIDGKIAFVGCKNIDDDPPEEYMMNLEGNVVTSLRADFASIWQDPLPTLAPQKLDFGQVPVVLMGKKYDVGPIQNREYNAMAVGFLTAIELAEREIYVQTLNLCTRHVVKSLLDATRRGVNVHIVTAYYSADTGMNVLPNCVGSNRKTAKYMYDELKDDAAALKRLKICWWIGPRNTDSDPKPRKDDWSHVKALAIDKELIIVGSANQDTLSWYHQYEFNVAFDDAKTTANILGALFKNQRNQQFCYHD